MADKSGVGRGSFLAGVATAGAVAAATAARAGGRGGGRDPSPR